MSYKLDIKDNTMLITGQFGTYEAIDDEHGGFTVSIVQDSYVAEMDSEGNEYFVNSGQEWIVPICGLSELNNFIQKCESERLWNFTIGPVFRVKIDKENNLMYIKGYEKSFVIGTDENGMYMDENFNSKKHNYIHRFSDISSTLIVSDKWWMRDVKETIEILHTSRVLAKVTDGGYFNIKCKDKDFVVGQKEDGQLWISICSCNEKSLCVKNDWRAVLELFTL